MEGKKRQREREREREREIEREREREKQNEKAAMAREQDGNAVREKDTICYRQWNISVSKKDGKKRNRSKMPENGIEAIVQLKKLFNKKGQWERKKRV